MNDTFPDQSRQILDILKKVFDFDPNVSTYNEIVKASIDKNRQKMKEHGISTYVSSGSKASYYKKKKRYLWIKNSKYGCDKWIPIKYCMGLESIVSACALRLIWINQDIADTHYVRYSII